MKFDRPVLLEKKRKDAEHSRWNLTLGGSSMEDHAKAFALAREVRDIEREQQILDLGPELWSDFHYLHLICPFCRKRIGWRNFDDQFRHFICQGVFENHWLPPREYSIFTHQQVLALRSLSRVGIKPFWEALQEFEMVRPESIGATG